MLSTPTKLLWQDGKWLSAGQTEPAQSSCKRIRNLRTLILVKRSLMTVVETDRFLKDADKLMPEEERMALIAFIAANPASGDVIPETGGVRKLRWALPGRGKRGGARVIYYFHSEQLPVFMLAAYGKNEKADLSKIERHTIAKIVPRLVAEYPAAFRRKDAKQQKSH